MTNRAREQLLRLEQDRVAAMVRGDRDALAALLADDLTYIHSDGRTDTKASFLDLVSGSAIRYLGVDFSNQDVIDCGDTAVVRGIARMRLDREESGHQDYRVIFLDVWTRRDGAWQMIAWQATRIP